MMGLLIINEKPIILSDIKSISQVFKADDQLTHDKFIHNGIFIGGSLKEVKDKFVFIIVFENYSRVYAFDTKEIAEEKLLYLVTSINNVLTSIPKIEL